MFKRLATAAADPTPLAQALLAGTHPALCAIGHCFQCLGTVDGVPDTRACRPRATNFTSAEMPPAEAVVIGAGPSGAACALALAAEGVETLLLDADAAPGGNVWRKPAGPDGGSGAWLRDRVARAAHLHHRAGIEVLDIRDGREIWALDRTGRGHIVTPRAIVVATGAIERCVPVPGWEMPGVFNLGGLQALAKGQGIVPHGKVLLAGTGPLLYLVADELRRAGVDLAAVVDSSGLPTLAAIGAIVGAPGLAKRALSYVAGLMRAGVPILRRHSVVRLEGDGVVRRAIVAPIGDPSRMRAFDIAAAGMGYGLLANTELVQAAGAELAHERALGGWHARVDGAGETSVADLYAIGEARGVRGVEAGLCDAPETAAAIVTRLGKTASAELNKAVARARHRREMFQRAARAMGEWLEYPPASSDPETVVCRCENVKRRAVDAALALDLGSPAALKMATRVGMGFCQGRVCAAAVAGAFDVSAGPPSVRFPLRPCPADAFKPET